MPEFTPAVMAQTVDEDIVGDFTSIYEVWYNPDKEFGIPASFGIANAKYNFGGGRELFRRGGYIVRRQGPDGYFYSLQVQEGILERLNPDYSVDWQIDIGSVFGTNDFFSAFYVTEDGIFIADGGLAGFGRAGVRIVSREDGTVLMEDTVNSALSGVAYDKENSAFFLTHSGSGQDEYLSKFTMDATVAGNPGEVFQVELSSDRNWLGESFMQETMFYDGSVYIFAVGRLYEVDPNNGRVIGKQAPLIGAEIDFSTSEGTGMNPQTIHITDEGKVHFLGQAAFEDEYSTYAVYNLQNGVLEKERDIRDYEYWSENRVPYAERKGLAGVNEVLSKDSLSDLGVSPYGYMLTVKSDVMPRLEFYNHDDELQWRIFSAVFTRDSVQAVLEQIYPDFEEQPQHWKDPPEINFAVSNDPVQINTTTSSGSATPGLVTEINPDTVVADSLPNVTQGEGTADTDTGIVEPQTGILGGGESIDGGPAADEINTLYTNTDSIPILPSIYTMRTGTVGNKTLNSSLIDVSVTVNPSQEQILNALLTNSTKVNVGVEAILVDTLGEADTVSFAAKPKATVLKPAPDDIWRSRVAGVGETTGADVIGDGK